MSTASGDIYDPIKVLFDTPIYEQTLKTCWFMRSYRFQIAITLEILRLQKKKKLTSAVTTEDIADLMVEEYRRTEREQLLESELDGLDNVVRPLLQLVWRVNTSLKMRDIEFEARKLLRSRETIPPLFQHPKITKRAHDYGMMLTERQQEAPRSKLLGPRDVVIELVPKVVQSFWVPPPNTSLNMPSKEFSVVAVGLTKAVEDQVSSALSSMLCEVTFSRSIRDNMVLSIQEKIKQDYTQDVFMRKLKCFSEDVLKTISDVAAGEICELFQPHICTEVPADRLDCIQPADVADGAEAIASTDEGEEPGLKEDIETRSVVTSPATPLPFAAESPTNAGLDQTAPSPDPDSAVVTTPPPVTPTNVGLDQTALSPDPDSAVVTTPPPPVTPTNIGLDHTAPSPDPDSAVVTTPPPVTPTNVGLDQTALSPDPDSAVVTTPPPVTPTNVGLDQTALSPDPDSAVVTTPPPPVTPTNIGLDHTAPSPDPESAVVTTPPPAVTPTNIGLDHTAPSPDPESAVVTTPPPPVTPASEAEVMAAVQDELIITGQPVRVEESFCTTTEVQKAKMCRFRSFFNSLKKIFCCCFLPEDDTE